MGQKQSGVGKKLSGIKLPIVWVLRSQRITQNPNPQEPIKFQYKTRKKPISLTCRNDVDKETVINDERNNMSVKTLGKHNCRLKESKLNNKRVADVKIPNTCRPPARTRSEPSLYPDRREKRLYKIKKSKPLNSEFFHFRKEFGYEIEDVDDFLTNATIEKPANIPVVLAFQSILYHTRAGGFQAEIQLPLGMVVNAVFKNENWLYVQTPHAVEGYVNYADCLPLGIIPPKDNSSLPLWENITDIFPKPCGNLTDTELDIYRSLSGSRSVYSACSEKDFDKLYLQATGLYNRNNYYQSAVQRHTLLVISSDYSSDNIDMINVRRGDVVSLLRRPVKNWLWVRKKNGDEGFIPETVAEYQFL